MLARGVSAGPFKGRQTLALLLAGHAEGVDGLPDVLDALAVGRAAWDLDVHRVALVADLSSEVLSLAVPFLTSVLSLEVGGREADLFLVASDALDREHDGQNASGSMVLGSVLVGRTFWVGRNLESILAPAEDDGGGNQRTRLVLVGVEGKTLTNVGQSRSGRRDKFCPSTLQGCL